MSLYAVFLRCPERGSFGRYGRRRFIGHVDARTAADARAGGRARFKARSCDRIEVMWDNGRRRYYGDVGAGSPGGVGLL
jgi:hypothetical protein